MSTFEILVLAVLSIPSIILFTKMLKSKAIKKLINKFVSKSENNLINELYTFRLVYNAALFNSWVKSNPEYHVHKSKRHHDGELCFGGGWFIVAAELPTGQISNHYSMEHWDLFKIPEHTKALFRYDGHTPQDVLKRLIDKEVNEL